MAHELTARRQLIHDPDAPGYVLSPGDLVTKDGQHYAAVRIGGRFYAHWVDHVPEKHTRHYNLSDTEIGEIFRPLAPGTTFEDIDGATYAKDDGTHWHFAHASPGEQYDWTLNAEATLNAMFQPAINAALLAAASSITVTGRSKGAAKAKTLIQFADEAQTELRKLADAATLGFFHQSEEDQTRKFVAQAITNVWQSWQVIPSLTDPQKAAQLRVRNGRVSGEIGTVLIDLKRTPTVETRTEQAARLAREAKEKEAADGTDGNSGSQS